MLDIQNPLNEYILRKLENDNIAIITNDLFLEDVGIALCCVPSPSNAYERKHLDGSVMGKRNYDYRCRAEDANVARSTLEKLLEVVDDLSLQVSGNIAYDIDNVDTDDVLPDMFIDCEATSAPVFLGIDDKGQSVYQCSISVTYNN